jgi:geranylgeranyl diphosphate synthase type I
MERHGKLTNVAPEAAMEEIQKIFKKRGTKAFEMARRAILEENLESEKAQQALTYFMTEYWHDVARPSLMALACEAVGGDAELTLPIAVPMVLISGAIDIHDDIIDQSKTKDGRRTVYGKFGKEIALLAGDALLFKGLTLLNQAKAKEISSEKMLKISGIIETMFFELGDAEALELDFRGRLDVSPGDYLRVVRTKAADVEAHTHISAILGNGSRREVKALSEFGRLLGMMIILRDDLIDLMVPEECLSRIRKEALPLPLLYGLRDPSQGSKLRSMIKNSLVNSKDAGKILKSVYKSGAMRRYSIVMKRIAAEAVSKLRSLSHDAAELELLVEAMLPTELEGVSD